MFSHIDYLLSTSPMDFLRFFHLIMKIINKNGFPFLSLESTFKRLTFAFRRSLYIYITTQNTILTFLMGEGVCENLCEPLLSQNIKQKTLLTPSVCHCLCKINLWYNLVQWLSQFGTMPYETLWIPFLTKQDPFCK